jgi:hypothetical protein
MPFQTKEITYTAVAYYTSNWVCVYSNITHTHRYIYVLYLCWCILCVSVYCVCLNGGAGKANTSAWLDHIIYTYWSRSCWLYGVCCGGASSFFIAPFFGEQRVCSSLGARTRPVLDKRELHHRNNIYTTA